MWLDNKVNLALQCHVADQEYCGRLISSHSADSTGSSIWLITLHWLFFVRLFVPVEVSLSDTQACKLALLDTPVINRSGVIAVETEAESEGKRSASF